MNVTALTSDMPTVVCVRFSKYSLKVTKNTVPTLPITSYGTQTIAIVLEPSLHSC